MTTTDLLSETFAALLVNKVRSGLTVLGIVIGIGSVIAMIAIGEGAQGMIQANIQSLGANLVMVLPGAQRGPGAQVSAGRGSSQTLTIADAEAIVTGAPDAKAISPEVSGRYQVTGKGTNTNTQVVGVAPTYPDVRNVSVAEGTFITDQQLQGAAKVVVIGPTVRDDLFGVGASAVGGIVRIKQNEFKVIGVTASKGGSGFNNQDDMLFVPITTAQRYLSGGQYVTTIAVQATSAATMAVLQQEITAVLLDRHRIADPTLADFSVLNQADIVSAASSVTDTFTLLLACVAGISLVVGGIGIMNMMLTTVTERMREIGLRKAIGAKRADVNTQFLAEAVVLTMAGGIVGIGVGWLAAWAVTTFGGITTSITWQSVALAVGVAAGIGIIFGYYPARRASRLNPIEALRYE